MYCHQVQLLIQCRSLRVLVLLRRLQGTSYSRYTIFDSKNILHIGGAIFYFQKPNIKMDIKKTGLGGVDWINLAQDRQRWQTLANILMNLQAP